jgi:VWFA-related protein
MLSRLLIATIVLALNSSTAPAQSFVDSNQTELIKAAPELTALQFDPDQSTLAPLLLATGQQLESMAAKFMNVTMTEDVHELRSDSARLAWKERRDKFQYVIETHPFVESRRQAQGGAALLPNPTNDFLLVPSFLDILSDLLPKKQSQARFRYLGRITESGAPNLVLAFAAQDGSRQGLVWVDERTKRIARVRTDLLKHSPEQKFDSFTRDVRFVAVKFSTFETSLWLPARATAHVRFSTGELHSVHRFSDYQAEGSKKDIGQATASVSTEDDPLELLVIGIAALQAGRPQDALAPLEVAAARLPDRIDPGYYLGLALYRTHDLAAAETQFRETIKRAPNLAIAHNNLGALLLERGDRAGAVAEAQEALRLDPGNPKMRANLDRALNQPGAASTPAGEPLSAAADDVTIKVDVRQVLVPVVVTDKEGHHVTGLTQADFKIFEDGIEQKITAFNSQRADVSAPASPSANPSQPPDAAAAISPKLLGKGRTYVICVDMMHASFGNFVHVREALRKQFREEQPGDSQYAVISLGRSIKIVQNTTSDPAKVLEALAESNFSKIYEPGTSQFEISQYESELQEVRAACDAKDPSCAPRKRALPGQAEALSERERVWTAQFLAEFRSIVEQMARGGDRRTLILISDGFLLAPAKIPYDLLQAYFPDIRSLRSLDTMQDSVEPIFKIAVKGNVPIYTIDSRGLYVSPTLDASRSGITPMQVDRALNDIAMDAGQTLSEIAAATGGTAFKNSNDLSVGLKKAFADGREYYMLAYVSSNEAQDGKFRKIEVRVRDTKALVSAKRGYWATVTEPRP